MKVNTTLLLFIFCLSFPLFAQKKENDQLFIEQIKLETKPFLKHPYFKKSLDFFLKKNWDSTLVYSMKQLSNSDKNIQLNNYCHFFRGISLRKKKVYTEAKNEFSKIAKDFYFYPRVTMLLGEVAFEQYEYAKSIAFFKEIENLKNPQLYGIQLSTIEHNLGTSYLLLNNFDKAEIYLQKSVKKLEGEKDTIKLINIYGSIATLYYDQYKDSLAIPYFQKAYQLSKKTYPYKLKSTTAKNMAVVEENRKNYKQAIIYHKEFQTWKDSLNDQNKIWAIAKLEKQFAVKQKQKEVDYLETENKLKEAERNKLFYLTIGLLLLLATGGFFYREKLKSNTIILKQKNALDELNTTKDKLFSIVSHDLRSSVNALKTSNFKLQESLVSKDYTELDKLLSTNSAITNGAYNLLDNLLNWALLQTQQGYFEITALRLYFIVEQVAYNYKPLLIDKNITFENTVSKKDLVDVDQESLKIILRNLIDNAIKFSNENGFIKIYAKDTDNKFLHLIIEDNGLGMSENTRIDLLKDTCLLTKKENKNIIGTGLGMQLCKQMIKKNKGEFNIESELGKGTKIIVSLLKNNS